MNTLMPFQPDAMTPAQLAAVSYLARYSGHTHTLYSSQLQREVGVHPIQELTVAGLSAIEADYNPIRGNGADRWSAV